MKYEITPCNVFDATCAINHKRAHVVQREPLRCFHQAFEFFLGSDLLLYLGSA